MNPDSHHDVITGNDKQEEKQTSTETTGTASWLNTATKPHAKLKESEEVEARKRRRKTCCGHPVRPFTFFSTPGASCGPSACDTEKHDVISGPSVSPVSLARTSISLVSAGTLGMHSRSSAKAVLMLSVRRRSFFGPDVRLLPIPAWSPSSRASCVAPGAPCSAAGYGAWIWKSGGTSPWFTTQLWKYGASWWQRCTNGKGSCIRWW
ncbi:hypothetical protein EYF80_017939 [Liparis tanakae]|uniref:Uncharacterized protein n=1 Tax=Liparis tanakae TaxID=230148 RepID=A0A4Z2I1G8_9TELE|nr:hypothetical protein EYF80_017939 [Liparis tanakae]